MRIIYTNSKGLSFDFTNAYGLTLYNIEGLAPTELNASTIRKAYTNGVVVNNTHRGERQIILNLALTAGQENDRIRRNLYDILGDKERGIFRYIDNDIDVFTEAYAEAPSVDVWTLTPTIQITFLCPGAFFKATHETVLNLYEVNPRLQFPLELKEGGIIMGEENQVAENYELINNGQASTGVRIEARFSQSVSGLIIENRNKPKEGTETETERLKNTIYSLNINFKSNTSFYDINNNRVTVSGFKAGDILTVTTETGEKGAMLYRDGTYIDIFSAVNYGNQWLRVERGKNIIRYAGGDNISNAGIFITLKFNELYWGV